LSIGKAAFSMLPSDEVDASVLLLTGAFIVRERATVIVRMMCAAPGRASNRAWLSLPWAIGISVECHLYGQIRPSRQD
jgi:hypothetical protein